MQFLMYGTCFLKNTFPKLYVPSCANITVKNINILKCVYPRCVICILYIFTNRVQECYLLSLLMYFKYILTCIKDVQYYTRYVYQCIPFLVHTTLYGSNNTESQKYGTRQYGNTYPIKISIHVQYVSV
jgi:hypothetical protein